MNAAAASVETRQSMMRVWMAISAVWVAFWLLIAAIVVFVGDFHPPFAGQLGPYATIVLAPPLALLMLGAVARLTFEASRKLARCEMGGDR
jgi:hypothetical protein